MPGGWAIRSGGSFRGAWTAGKTHVQPQAGHLAAAARCRLRSGAWSGGTPAPAPARRGAAQGGVVSPGWRGRDGRAVRTGRHATGHVVARPPHPEGARTMRMKSRSLVCDADTTPLASSSPSALRRSRQSHTMSDMASRGRAAQAEGWTRRRGNSGCSSSRTLRRVLSCFTGRLIPTAPLPCSASLVLTSAPRLVGHGLPPNPLASAPRERSSCTMALWPRHWLAEPPGIPQKMRQLAAYE